MKRIIILFSILFLILSLAYAGQIVPAKFQAFDANGDPLNGGKLYTCTAGGSCPGDNKTTYSDSSLSTPNANPVVLNSRGEASIFGSGLYKFVLKDSDDTTIWTMDNIEVLNYTAIHDADNDTKIQTEESSDEDIIRFDIGGTEQVTIQDGKIEPTTDNDVDIGAYDKQFRNVYSEMFLGYVQRSKFAYKDTDEIYINPGVYDVDGKIAKINSQLEQGTCGSDGFSYIYIDYSLIPASGDIDASDIYCDTVAPSYTAAKRGYYHATNTSDRCIFSVFMSAVPQLKSFFHDGGEYVIWDLHKLAGQTSVTDNDYTDIDIDDAWDDCYLVIPPFATRAAITVMADTNSDTGKAELSYRYNGSGFGDNEILTADGDWSMFVFNSLVVFTDSSQIIELHAGIAGDHTFTVWTDGWFFPAGM